MNLEDGDYLSKNDLDLRLFWTFCNKVISFWWQVYRSIGLPVMATKSLFNGFTVRVINSKRGGLTFIGCRFPTNYIVRITMRPMLMQHVTFQSRTNSKV